MRIRHYRQTKRCRFGLWKDIMTTRQWVVCLFAAVFVSGCAGSPGESGGANVQVAQRRPISDASTAATSVISDGGFESGGFSAGWSQCGTVPADATIQSTVVHSGSFAAQTGSPTSEPNGKSGVCQSFVVPAGASLTVWINEQTNETSTKFADQEADLLNSSGTVVSNLYTDVATSSGWVERTISLSQFAGETL